MKTKIRTTRFNDYNFLLSFAWVTNVCHSEILLVNKIVLFHLQGFDVITVFNFFTSSKATKPITRKGLHSVNEYKKKHYKGAGKIKRNRNYKDRR